MNEAIFHKYMIQLPAIIIMIYVQVQANLNVRNSTFPFLNRKLLNLKKIYELNLKKRTYQNFLVYRIVASTNTCYYSENQVFGGETHFEKETHLEKETPVEKETPFENISNLSLS